MNSFWVDEVRKIADRTGIGVRFVMLANRLIRRGSVTVLFVLCLFLAGCAGTGMADLKSQIGIMTYDQVLLDLGPPNHVADLEDGGKVAQWLQYSSRVYSTPTLGYYGAWGPWGGYGAANVNSTPAVFLLLTFGPDQKLVSVRQQYK